MPANREHPEAVIQQECGIEASRIRAWLDVQPLAQFDCCFSVEECSPRVLGRIALPRCIITIRGNRKSCDELYRRFFLAFLSAGG